MLALCRKVVPVTSIQVLSNQPPNRCFPSPLNQPEKGAFCETPVLFLRATLFLFLFFVGGAASKGYQKGNKLHFFAGPGFFETKPCLAYISCQALAEQFPITHGQSVKDSNALGVLGGGLLGRPTVDDGNLQGFPCSLLGINIRRCPFYDGLVENGWL